MQKSIEFKGFEPAEGARLLVDRLIERVERKTRRLSPTILRIVLEETPAHSLYRVAVTLEIPGATLVGREETHALEPAIRRAFAELERQIEAHTSAVRGEHWWKRLARRKALREMKAGAAAGKAETSAAFFSEVDPHVPALTDFAKHIIRYAEARGDLAAGDLAPEDLVSDVLLQAHEEFVKERPRIPIRSWLMRLALRQLKLEIARSRQERGQTIHVEGSAPKTPPSEEVVTLGDEILDFYQPDEALKIEEVLPDIRTPTPEEQVEHHDLRRCVRQALNELAKERVACLFFGMCWIFGERN